MRMSSNVAAQERLLSSLCLRSRPMDRFKRVLSRDSCRGQRREPAARDVEFESEGIGWLRLAAPSGSDFLSNFIMNS